jgi:hypothetical protein
LPGRKSENIDCIEEGKTYKTSMSPPPKGRIKKRKKDSRMKTKYTFLKDKPKQKQKHYEYV